MRLNMVRHEFLLHGNSACFLFRLAVHHRAERT